MVSFLNLVASHLSFSEMENDYVGELDVGPRYYSHEMGRFMSPDPSHMTLVSTSIQAAGWF
ncbi:MAG: hypothetical protein IPH75_08030 [bacterium]|nr:hypothetical protein [bacterium]